MIIEGLNLIQSPFEYFSIIEQGIIFYTYLLGPVLKLIGELLALEDLLDLLFKVLVIITDLLGSSDPFDSLKLARDL